MLDFGYVSSNGQEPDLDELVSANLIAFDTETSGVNIAKDHPYGLSLTANPECAFYTGMDNRFFLDLLADESVTKLIHNAPFDRAMLKKYGITIDNLCDTMIAAHLLEEPRLSLEVLLKRYIKGKDLNIKFFKDYNKPIAQSTLQEMANHFGPHSSGTLALWNVLQRELRANGLWHVFWDIEMPAVPPISEMEINGFLIDVPYLKGLGDEYDRNIVELEGILRDITRRPDCNFNSSDQAADVIFEQFKVPKPPAHMKKLWTAGGRPSVDKEYLSQFTDKFPFLKYYIEYKFYRHLKDTYVTGILERLVDGRIHTNFNQTRTRTGRLSSTDPNLQNIPQRSKIGKQIRWAFIASPDCTIVKADMSQVELRKAACLSNCIPMLNAFREGRDIHMETAVRAYGPNASRADGKTMNFKLVYGGGDAETQKILFDAYPQIKTWSDKMMVEFELFGYAKTDNGRRRHLGNFATMTNKERAHGHREGLSLMNQGSCSEYLKGSMAKLHKHIRSTDTKMQLQVHDELVFNVPNKMLHDFIPMLRGDMLYDKLQIPMPAEISTGANWGQTVEAED